MDVSLSELQEFVMDREAWRAAIFGIAKSRTQPSDWTELNLYSNFQYSCYYFSLDSSIIHICSWFFLVLLISHTKDYILNKAIKV